MTYEEIQAEIRELEQDIANFNHNHGSPVGCNMRMITLNGMRYRLKQLYKKLEEV